jgi:protein involved in polysaccharide export with SLBB domain
VKKSVIVGGLVVKPGVVDFKPNATIYAMIIAAGGPTEIGTLARVELHRADKVRCLNLTHEDAKKKELAQPNDSIVVRAKFFPGR